MKNKIACPVCGRHFFERVGDHEICPVCGWENDRIQYEDPEFRGGANKMSLTEAREEFNIREKEEVCNGIEVDEQKKQELLKVAMDARTYAYCPYSGFAVGAALLGSNGIIYTGCNIENAAFTPTNCAERTAFFKAISEGQKSFLAIAIVGGPKNGELQMTMPCGVCRQVMQEFCDPETFRIIVGTSVSDLTEYSLKEILPGGFDLKHE